jgi:3-hydroxyacyl-[acyl-carrier-protein] dehydratase
VADRIIIAQILDLIPQKEPFLFIDDILDADDKNITAVYRFKKDEHFYKGHFPSNPITPGVILIEAMAQTSVVAMGIYQLLQQGMSVSELKQMTTLFAFADAIEFTGIVYPDEQVIIRGETIYLRKGNLKTRTSIERKNGEIVCTGVLTGTGVKR